MPTIHRVQQGEHLSVIAHQYGFSNYLTVWNHPANKELKALRVNPNVLYPGDEVTIPDKQSKEVDRSTEKQHRFVRYGKPLKLRLVFEENYFQPLADTECQLLVGANLVPLKTDESGQIEIKIPVALSGTLVFLKETRLVKGIKVPFTVQIPIKVGFLDPVDTQSGQLARFVNLGYYRSSVEKIDERELLSAIEEFQCEHNLTVDGKCGPKTQAKLKEIHGC